MATGREILVTRLHQQLGTLVGSVEIAARNNLGSTYVVAETTLAGLLNRVYGWELVNANAGTQNYPGVDLIDVGRKIAVQVTATRTVKKVRHTLEEVARLGVTFERLILLVISNQPATPDMKASAGPMELWSIPDVFRAAKELDVKTLANITAYMDGELGSVTAKTAALPHLEMPPVSSLEPTDFVGREAELAEIGQRFADGDAQVVLTGLGGMGKTELAVQYGRAQSTAYFVRFDTDFTRTLASMAKGIRPRLTDEELQQDDGSLCQRVLELLEQSGRSDLLIIDNADSPTGALADLLRDPVYRAIRALPLRRLLTTRSHAPRAIEVRSMEAQPLFKIFENHGAELTRAEMEALIGAVNGHTLTVDLIARTLNGRGWRRVTAEDMLTALRERTLREQKYRKIATDYSQSPEQAQIYEHLSVVFDMSGMSGHSQQVMRCASLLPDGGMDAELFGNSLEEAEQEALDTLLGQGWLEVQKGLMTIHPIIRLVCQEELKPTVEACGAFLKNVWSWYDHTKYDKEIFRQLAELFTVASDALGDPNGGYIGLAGFLWNELAESRFALVCNLRALKLSEQGQPDSKSLAAAYSNVGRTYGNLRDHQKALEYHLKALAIFEKVLPLDHPTLAISYDNVGHTYCVQDDHEKALEYHLRALAIFEKVLPSDHPDLATSYNNLGITYSNLDNHQKALEYLLKALVIRKKVLPPDHPNLAQSYSNLSCAYYEMGQYKQALEWMRRAAQIADCSLPEGHPTRVAYHRTAQLLEFLIQRRSHN